MKKGQKESGDKNKKKGWGARLMSLIAGSSDEELAPSDDDQDDAPRGKGAQGKGAHASGPKFVQQAEPAPVDSRAALKKMLKDPEQKKVQILRLIVCQGGGASLCRFRRCTSSRSTWGWTSTKIKSSFGLLLRPCLLLCQEIGRNLKMNRVKSITTITGLCASPCPVVFVAR
jgi:hypothetical protein